MATTNARALRAIRTKQNKLEIIAAIVEATGVKKNDVMSVIDALGTQAKRHLMKRGSGEFTVPSLGVKLQRVDRSPRKARNPKTGETIRLKARRAIKATPLKSLKDVVA